MRATFIAVGSEMLDADLQDTNGLYASGELRKRGILTDLKLVVRDNLDQLSWLVRKSAERSQIVVISGGLGPTRDDLTREAVALGLKRELLFRDDILAELQAFFRERHKQMPEVNSRQAFILEGAEVIANPLGTAPGQYINTGSCQLFLLPGPPGEFCPLLDHCIEKYLQPQLKFHVLQHTVFIAGLGESEVEQLAGDLYSLKKNPFATILAREGVIELRFTVRAKNEDDEALRARLQEVLLPIREKLKDNIFSESDPRLASAVLELLKSRGLKLAVAESCSGGVLAAALTAVAGASRAFLGGVVCYSNELKQELLGVREETLATYGAVSAAVCNEMAAGILEKSGADLGIAITGIAGPDGATAEKPLGLVFISLADQDGPRTHKLNFSGSREMIRRRAANTALYFLWKHLKAFDPGN